MTDEQKVRQIEELPREAERIDAEEAEKSEGGKVTMQDFHFTMRKDRSSPVLF